MHAIVCAHLSIYICRHIYVQIIISKYNQLKPKEFKLKLSRTPEIHKESMWLAAIQWVQENRMNSSSLGYWAHAYLCPSGHLPSKYILTIEVPLLQCLAWKICLMFLSRHCPSLAELSQVQNHLTPFVVSQPTSGLSPELDLPVF